VSERGKLAIVPLAAISVAFVVSAVHQRRAHNPEVAHQAVEVFVPETNDPHVAYKQLYAFFEHTTVDWDPKTEVEIACGPDIRRDPVSCARKARSIAIVFERDERYIHERYTWLMYAGIVFGLLSAFSSLRYWQYRRSLKGEADKKPPWWHRR
jgi:hypothetical protein